MALGAGPLGLEEEIASSGLLGCLSSWVDTLYTFWDSSTHYKTESVHFWGLMNSATKMQTLGFRDRAAGFPVLLAVAMLLWGVRLAWKVRTSNCHASRDKSQSSIRFRILDSGLGAWEFLIIVWVGDIKKWGNRIQGPVLQPYVSRSTRRPTRWKPWTWWARPWLAKSIP